MGADGVVAATADGLCEVPGTGRGQYADPTGAGDCWTAAYLLGRSRGARPAARRPPKPRPQTDLLYLLDRGTQGARCRVLFAPCRPTASGS